MKGSYFGFGSPQQQVDMHARSKNTLFSIIVFICTLLAQRLPSNSFFQTPSLRDANLLWLVSSSSQVSPVILIKQCLWAQCCFALPGKPICVPLQKRHLVAKNEFAFSLRPKWKDQQVRGNMLMLTSMNGLGLVLKTSRFNDSESTLSFERQ